MKKQQQQKQRMLNSRPICWSGDFTVKWDYGDVGDRPPSRNAPRGGTVCEMSWSSSSTIREAPPLQYCWSSLQPGYTWALSPPVLPADLSAQLSLKHRLLSWIPVHFSRFPLSAPEHWKTCFPPFLWNCQFLVTLQPNFLVIFTHQPYSDPTTATSPIFFFSLSK